VVGCYSTGLVVRSVLRNFSSEPDLRRATKTEKSTAQSIGESTLSCSPGSPLCLASFGTEFSASGSLDAWPHPWRRRARGLYTAAGLGREGKSAELAVDPNFNGWD
jgi:hypothetical protein